MNVSGIIVTRGDVDLEPCFETWPPEWQKVVWNNGAKMVDYPPNLGSILNLADLSVYGRYEAIGFADHDLIYVQDDDVIVSDPQAVVDSWFAEYALTHSGLLGNTEADGKFVVCNMPQEFRHDGYTDSALVGFGAAFHRDAPARAFDSFMEFHDHMIPLNIRQDMFWRTCDVVFMALTPRVLVDVPKQNREFAEDANRMYRQPDHVGERARMLELARKVRDA